MDEKRKEEEALELTADETGELVFEEQLTSGGMTGKFPNTVFPIPTRMPDTPRSQSSRLFPEIRILLFYDRRAFCRRSFFLKRSADCDMSVCRERTVVSQLKMSGPDLAFIRQYISWSDCMIQIFRKIIVFTHFITLRYYNVFDYRSFISASGIKIICISY